MNCLSQRYISWNFNLKVDFDFARGCWGFWYLDESWAWKTQKRVLWCLWMDASTSNSYTMLNGGELEANWYFLNIWGVDSNIFAMKWTRGEDETGGKVRSLKMRTAVGGMCFKDLGRLVTTRWREGERAHTCRPVKTTVERFRMPRQFPLMLYTTTMVFGRALSAEQRGKSVIKVGTRCHWKLSARSLWHLAQQIAMAIFTASQISRQYIYWWSAASEIQKILSWSSPMA